MTDTPTREPVPEWMMTAANEASTYCQLHLDDVRPMKCVDVRREVASIIAAHMPDAGQELDAAKDERDGARVCQQRLEDELAEVTRQRDGLRTACERDAFLADAAICLTPTGPAREKLTELNILRLAAIDACDTPAPADDELERLRAAVAKMSHRVCHDCGHDDYYVLNIRPYCECAKCGSADTRVPYAERQAALAATKEGGES